MNVGGHKAFRPSVLAGKLASLGVVSIGAAGTFVVHADAPEPKIRAEFAKHLPFQTTLLISPAREIRALVRTNPFAGESGPESDGQFISVIEARPRNLPAIPIRVPEGENWQVALIAVHGRLVATLMRKVGRNLLYPNEVVERQFGVLATTRGWPTILKIHQALC